MGNLCWFTTKKYDLPKNFRISLLNNFVLQTRKYVDISNFLSVELLYQSYFHAQLIFHLISKNIKQTKSLQRKRRKKKLSFKIKLKM